MRTSSATHWMPLISGASHSSKYTFGRRGKRWRSFRDGIEAALRADRRRHWRVPGDAHQRAEPAHVVDDAGDAAVVADPDLDAAADQLGGDIGLDIGKPDHEIRPELEDFVDLRGGEGADFRFLAARARRAHGETGDADDAMRLTERVKRLGGLFGQADDAFRAGHRTAMAASRK